MSKLVIHRWQRLYYIGVIPEKLGQHLDCNILFPYTEAKEIPEDYEMITFEEFKEDVINFYAASNVRYEYLDMLRKIEKPTDTES